MQSKVDVGAVLIQLKPNRKNELKAWQQELNARKSEAIETLKAEGVLVESWFYLQIEGKDFLMACMRAENIKKAQQIARNSAFTIDAVHRAFKQNWEKVYPAELLLDLDNSQNENNQEVALDV